MNVRQTQSVKRAPGMKPNLGGLLCALWLIFFQSGLLVFSGSAHAQQYRTQVQEVPESETKQATQQDLEQQLDQLGSNPYGKALTLQHLSGLAAKKGDLKKARDYLQQAIDLGALSDPANEEMRANLGQIYAAEGNHKKVIDTLQPLLDKGVAADSIDSRAWLALGNAYANLGQWDKAVAPLQRASKAGSRDEALYRLQLAVFMRAKRYDAAAEVLQNLLKLGPDNKTYLLQLAAVQSKRGKHSEAVAALEIAQRRGMLDNAGERLQLIRAYLSSGAPYDAATQLEAWMNSGQIPANGGNYELLAAAWTQAEEFERAIEPLSKAASSLGQARLFAQLGQLHMDLANWSKAIDAFQSALSRGGIGNANGELLMSLGLAYYQKSSIDLARASFSKAQGYGKVANIAGQWIKFLDARPAGLQPLEIRGLAGRVSDTERELAQSGLVGEGSSGQGDGAGAEPVELPASVPETGDRWTPVGALRAGNSEGTIPPWRGGLTAESVPGDYEPGKRITNPYGNESPKFTITQANYKQYADVLSAGHRALFNKYPDYRMKVYPTHRSAAFPEAIYKATLANQKRARLEGPDSLVGAQLGFPFRRPNNGVEVMWNHRLRYRSNDIWSRTDEAVVAADGGYSVKPRIEEVLFGYGNINKPPNIGENIIAYYLAYLEIDGRSDGLVLAHETMNKRRGERRIWVGVPGLARLFRLPPVGYDNPRPGTGNLMFVDQIDMYNGSFDRYVWRLVGRKEMLVPYNAYGLLNQDIRYSNLLKSNFPDPEELRYERHRVWVIEATERGGEKHEFGKRVYYVDEDSWSILMVDNYDRDGNLWRFQEGHAVQYYDLMLTYTAPVFLYDLKDGRYLATRLGNEAPGVFYNTNRYKVRDFLPAAARRRLR